MVFLPDLADPNSARKNYPSFPVKLPCGCSSKTCGRHKAMISGKYMRKCVCGKKWKLVFVGVK